MLFLLKAVVFTYDINTLLAWEIFLLHSIKNTYLLYGSLLAFFFHLSQR